MLLASRRIIPPFRGQSLIAAHSAGVYNAFPGLVELPGGALYVRWRVGASHTGGGHHEAAVSFDGGETWLSLGTVFDSGDDDRDVDMTLLLNGRVVAQFFTYTGPAATAWLQFGTPKGATVDWADPVELPTLWDEFTACASRPLQIGDGTLRCFIYGKNGADDFWSAGMVTLAENGTPQGDPVLIAEGESGSDFTEANAVLLPDGRAYYKLRNDQEGYFGAHSTDDTVSAFAAVEQTWESSGNGPGKPAIALLNNNELLQVGRQTTTVAYRISSNGRMTWPASFTLLAEGKEEYSSLIVRKDGRGIACVFADEPTGDENDGARLHFQHFDMQGAPA